MSLRSTPVSRSAPGQLPGSPAPAADQPSKPLTWNGVVEGHSEPLKIRPDSTFRRGNGPNLELAGGCYRPKAAPSLRSSTLISTELPSSRSG
jgi:hypothetical protein